ncbi:MAG: monofunctional biosynthetic peptidoglycan transglycosylase [Chitinophagaceae bacterium]
MKTKGLVPRLWRSVKKILLFLFILQFLYIIILKWMNPPVTLTQLSSFVRGNGLKRNYISGENMPANVKLAVIAAEDQLFADHNGFDWKSIEKAMAYNKKKPNRIRGASTISQQVAKNVFLWQGRSYVRKGLEMYFTFMIELIWGKERILEMYLNVSEMGKGVFGIEAAAGSIFNKTASRLSRQECAMIASSLPNPVLFTVRPLSKYVSRRYPWVLRQMNALERDPDIQVIIGLPTFKKPATLRST